MNFLRRNLAVCTKTPTIVGMHCETLPVGASIASVLTHLLDGSRWCVVLCVCCLLCVDAVALVLVVEVVEWAMDVPRSVFSPE